jgi:hypothetical protein
LAVRSSRATMAEVRAIAAIIREISHYPSDKALSSRYHAISQTSFAKRQGSPISALCFGGHTANRQGSHSQLCVSLPHLSRLVCGVSGECGFVAPSHIPKRADTLNRK